MYLPFYGAEQEDQILRWFYPDWRYRGTMLDVGSGDPVLINNSYHFEQNGWRVLCIEANPFMPPAPLPSESGLSMPLWEPLRQMPPPSPSFAGKLSRTG